ISDFVVAIDVDLAQRQQITWVAGAFVATTGYDPADSGVLAGLGALVVADDQPIWHDHVRNVTAGRSDVCELRITTRSGHTCWMQIFSQPELNDRSPQSSIRIISAARDITPRKEAEAELQQANTQLKHWVANLEQRTREMTMLNEMGEWLQTCQLPEEAYGVIAQFGTQLFPGTSGAFYARQADQSESQVERVAFWGNAPPDEQLFGPDDCWGLRRGRPYLLHDGGTGVRCRHLPNLKWSGSLCIPLITQGDILGLLHLRQPADGSGRGAVNTFSDLHGLAIIAAEHFSLALANVQLRETLRQQAIRDPLTGLFNRRYMEESIEREVRRVERSRSALGVIMLDLDHFKSFNDTFTHLAGDLLLREIGLLLQRSIRSEDIACRYGGEEFTLILPDATLNDTIQRAEALRGQIKQLEVVYRGQPLGSISVSVGLAAYPDHGDTGEAVLRIADTALLRAKAAGRDQIRVGIE
ncbi:MAG TPA: diguanylate cyclase, partial [Roseiflexaceae bacterium]|nr:diguanylate cyclase [Roseiflexaceae bacterium]